MTRGRRASLRSLGPALLIGALAFTLTLDWRAQGRADRTLAGRRVQLARVVEIRQRNTQALEARLLELRDRMNEETSRSRAPALQALRAQLDRLAGSSGMRAIRGPGIRVRLSDAADANDRSVNEDDARIQDVDIQAVVNSLWDAGAEAIAVNGQRIVSSTAIRNAGGAILVNYRVLTSPYSIIAIGDTRAMHRVFARSSIAGRFRAWSEIYGLGFSLSDASDLRAPAYAGSVRFRYAHPISNDQR